MGIFDSFLSKGLGAAVEGGIGLLGRSLSNKDIEDSFQRARTNIANTSGSLFNIGNQNAEQLAKMLKDFDFGRESDRITNALLRVAQPELSRTGAETINNTFAQGALGHNVNGLTGGTLLTNFNQQLGDFLVNANLQGSQQALANFLGLNNALGNSIGTALSANQPNLALILEQLQSDRDRAGQSNSLFSSLGKVGGEIAQSVIGDALGIKSPGQIATNAIKQALGIGQSTPTGGLGFGGVEPAPGTFSNLTGGNLGFGGVEPASGSLASSFGFGGLPSGAFDGFLSGAGLGLGAGAGALGSTALGAAAGGLGVGALGAGAAPFTFAPAAYGLGAGAGAGAAAAPGLFSGLGALGPALGAALPLALPFIFKGLGLGAKQITPEPGQISVDPSTGRVVGSGGTAGTVDALSKIAGDLDLSQFRAAGIPVTVRGGNTFGDGLAVDIGDLTITAPVPVTGNANESVAILNQVLQRPGLIEQFLRLSPEHQAGYISTDSYGKIASGRKMIDAGRLLKSLAGIDITSMLSKNNRMALNPDYSNDNP